jgi:hypothetical protein
MSLTKVEIEKAVAAIRSLSDVIEKLHKSTWPDVADGDIIRKDGIADPKADPADVALAAMADLRRRLDELQAADAGRARDDEIRKSCAVKRP